jgi:ribonucleoside-diphosphate reductase beta chain
MAATLDQLALQGDPGTLESDEQAAKLRLMPPQQLYELWERQHWLSQEIDFSTDVDDWSKLDDFTREQFVWGLSAFFIGEERVTTQFSALVTAYEDEKEEAYLTTQQVDEARHMQFFDRFYSEVVGIDDPSVQQRLARVRENLNEHFIELFDKVLVESGQRLLRNPTDVAAKVDFITTYHLVIEGTLALTGQKFITGYIEQEQLLPGFVEGFNKVARDEHRHVAYGAWYLQRTAGKDPELAALVRERLKLLLPLAAGVLVPPGFSLGEEWTLFGYSADEVNGFAFDCLSRRLRAIGVPLLAEESLAAS